MISVDADERDEDGDGGDAGIELVKVQVSEDVSNVCGPDMKEYGPLEAGETAEIPKQNAQALRDSDAAEPLDGACLSDDEDEDDGDASEPADDEDERHHHELEAGAIVAMADAEDDRHVDRPTELPNSAIGYYVNQILKHHPEHHYRYTTEGRVVYRFDPDAGIWKPDGEEQLRNVLFEALHGGNSKTRWRELKHAVKSDADNAIDRSELGAPDGTVAVANGLLDLREREVRELRPDDYALNRIPHEFDPDAECPRWEAFVREVVEDGKLDAVQEYVGYCLLAGELPYDRALLLVGEGSNGKSTFLNVVNQLLGPENVTGFSLGDLAHDEYYAAEMYGALANIDADVTGGIGGGGMFKKLVGGDQKVSARPPYGKPFDFHPTTKQLYAANQVPDTDVDDDAFFRRWLIVEFPTTFTDKGQPGPDKDDDLEDKLMEELPGVLNWALDGLERLLEQGQFTNEGTTDEKRNRWQAWGDTIDKFIDRCIDTDADGKHRTADVHDRYVDFVSSELGETPENQRAVTNALKKEEAIKYSDNFRFDGKKARGFKGFGWADQAPDPDEGATQQDVIDEVLSVVDEGDRLDAGVPWQTAVETVRDNLGPENASEERVDAAIKKLLRQGGLQEPTDGTLERT